MNEQAANKPQTGAWQRIGTKQDRISFEVNIPVQVTFLTDEPDEVAVDDGVFYSFSVKLIDGKESKISTSAWTLLEELKRLVPLTGKTVQITKKLEKGKQKFTVAQIV